jgi:ABC-type xylose transport system substrate-binding protein
MESLTQTFLQIDGVLAANQTIATGIVKAHEAANHLALVTGIDAIPEAIDFAFPE